MNFEDKVKQEFRKRDIRSRSQQSLQSEGGRSGTSKGGQSSQHTGDDPNFDFDARDR